MADVFGTRYQEIITERIHAAYGLTEIVRPAIDVEATRTRLRWLGIVTYWEHPSPALAEANPNMGAFLCVGRPRLDSNREPSWTVKYGPVKFVHEGVNTRSEHMPAALYASAWVNGVEHTLPDDVTGTNVADSLADIARDASVCLFDECRCTDCELAEARLPWILNNNRPEDSVTVGELIARSLRGVDTTDSIALAGVAQGLRVETFEWLFDRATDSAPLTPAEWLRILRDGMLTDSDWLTVSTGGNPTVSDYVSLNEIASYLRARGVSATVEQTGGGVATLYAGALRGDYYGIAAGPGFFAGPGFSAPFAHTSEFGFGPDGSEDSEFVTEPNTTDAREIAQAIEAALTARGWDFSTPA